MPLRLTYLTVAMLSGWAPAVLAQDDNSVTEPQSYLIEAGHVTCLRVRDELALNYSDTVDLGSDAPLFVRHAWDGIRLTCESLRIEGEIARLLSERERLLSERERLLSVRTRLLAERSRLLSEEERLEENWQALHAQDEERYPDYAGRDSSQRQMRRDAERLFIDAETNLTDAERLFFDAEVLIEEIAQLSVEAARLLAVSQRAFEFSIGADPDAADDLLRRLLGDRPLSVAI